jgi:hypothetical protein
LPIQPQQSTAHNKAIKNETNRSFDANVDGFLTMPQYVSILLEDLFQFLFLENRTEFKSQDDDFLILAARVFCVMIFFLVLSQITKQSKVVEASRIFQSEQITFAYPPNTT